MSSRVSGKLLFVSEQTRVEAYRKLGELWLAEDREEPCPLGSVPGEACEACNGTGVVPKVKMEAKT